MAIKMDMRRNDLQKWKARWAKQMWCGMATCVIK